MSKKLYLILLFIGVCIISACKPKNGLKHILPDKRLSFFQAKYLYTVGESDKASDSIQTNSARLNAISSPDLNDEIDTLKYLNGMIYISCLKSTAGCSEYEGDIKFNVDTIKLLVVNKSERVCTELVVWRMIYKIENKENKRYFLKKN